MKRKATSKPMHEIMAKIGEYYKVFNCSLARSFSSFFVVYDISNFKTARTFITTFVF